MKTQTIAQKITNIENYTDALIEADKLAVDKAQDYEAETTVFVFEDDSCVKADGIVQEIKIN